MCDSIMLLKWSAPTIKKTNHQQAQPTFNVIQPGPYDVLCDRSRFAFNHIGNRRFRITVETKVPHYAVATHKSDRSRIVRSIVGIIHGAGGRFLTRSNCGEWKQVSKVRSKEKVGHALRAAISARNLEEERTIYDIIGAVDTVGAPSADQEQQLAGESRKRKLCETQHDACPQSSNDMPMPDSIPSNDHYNLVETDNESAESTDTAAMLNQLYEPDMALDSDEVLIHEFDPFFDDVDENVEMLFDQQCIGQYSHFFEELEDVFDEQNDVNLPIASWTLADDAPCTS